MLDTVDILQGKPVDTGSGWLAELDLEFVQKRERTILANKKTRGPLTVQRPFYPESDVCHVYLLHPPGGVVGGDGFKTKYQG